MNYPNPFKPDWLLIIGFKFTFKLSSIFDLISIPGVLCLSVFYPVNGHLFKKINKRPLDVYTVDLDRWCVTGQLHRMLRCQCLATAQSEHRLVLDRAIDRKITNRHKPSISRTAMNIVHTKACVLGTNREMIHVLTGGPGKYS